jgi:uncharacterized protein
VAHDNPFRLNVGFVAHERVGYSRDFLFDIPEVQLEDLPLQRVTGHVLVTRTPQGLLVQAHLEADTPAECVRCLEPFDLHLTTDFTELYAFTRKNMGESGLLYPESGQINLAPLVREYMWLAFPIKPLCSEDCKGLCPVCGANRNVEDCGHRPESIDPRLEILKTLLEQ